MNTERLFKANVYLKECGAVVTGVYDCPASKGGPEDLAVTLDRTVFFPTGGGQSCDTGTLGAFPVAEVYEKDDEIYHVVKGAAGKLAVGDTVECAIDWARRFDNMQRHCGEHILSGVFYQLYGGVNRGFHMGEDYMTIDISLEDDPAYTELTWEMAKAAELGTNRVIWQDLPVVARHFDTKEEAEAFPMRKKLAIERDITIVTIGDPMQPADSVACCGTHPAHTGQVGLVKLYKVEPNKGMFRVYFEAGERAFRQYGERYEVLTRLEKDLSAGFPDLMTKYDARNEKQKAVRDRLYHLTKKVLEQEAAAIEPHLGEPAFLREYEILTLDDLLALGRSLQGKIPHILFLVHRPSHTVLLFSDTAHCGRLVKDNAPVFGGKGGGGKDNARALFTKKDDADMFVDAVEKLLR